MIPNALACTSSSHLRCGGDAPRLGEPLQLHSRKVCCLPAGRDLGCDINAASQGLGKFPGPQI